MCRFEILARVGLKKKDLLLAPGEHSKMVNSKRKPAVLSVHISEVKLEVGARGGLGHRQAALPSNTETLKFGIGKLK